MENDRALFKPDTVFHIYNHGNAEDLIFREDKNYSFFLKKYQKYIPPIADTFAYCLLPNHFHFMIKVESQNKLKQFYLKKYPNKDPQSFQNFTDLVSNQFKNFLIFNLN